MNPLLISAILEAIKSIVGNVFPDTTEEKKQELVNTLTVQLAQIKVDEQEALSPSMFVSGARPFIMWVCAAAFSWQFVLLPIILFIATASGHPVHDLPVFDSSTMNNVLMGLLGLGGLRTFEKIKGVNRNNMSV